MDEKLELRYCSLTTVRPWDENPKLHDKERLKASIRLHGFKDPPKYEPALNHGNGGIVAGNGRIVCLQEMKAAGEPPPRGIIIHQDEWLVPILFGVDAASEAAAQAYAIDHNNLTASAHFTAYDLAQLWDTTGYLSILSRIEISPVTVSDSDREWLHYVTSTFSASMFPHPPQPEEHPTKTTPYSISFTVRVISVLYFHDIIAAVRELLSQHPEWDARIEV